MIKPTLLQQPPFTKPWKLKMPHRSEAFLILDILFAN
jgi:hypothetical protein